MKNQCIAFVVICIFAMIPAVAQSTIKKPLSKNGAVANPTVKKDSPSLQEALAFVKEKLTESGNVRLRTSDGTSRSLNFVPEKFDSCNVIYRIGYSVSKEFTTLPTFYHEKSLPVSSLDTARTTVETSKMFADVWQIRLYTVESKKVIGEATINTNGSRTGAYVTSLLSIFVKDEESGERIAKAINHAATLCKAQVEPF